MVVFRQVGGEVAGVQSVSLVVFVARNLNALVPENSVL